MIKRPSRQELLRGLMASGLLAGAGCLPRPEQAPALAPKRANDRRPNILLIVSDQERAAHLLPDLERPAHDRLRAEGVSFRNFFANTTPCSPSRSVLYFGQHAQNTGMVSNLHAPPDPKLGRDLVSIGARLRAAGYYAAYKGKWHLSDFDGDFNLSYGRFPTTRDGLEAWGFADFNDDGDPHGSAWTGYEKDGAIASSASEWLRRQGAALKGERPWFLAVNFVNPHDIMFVETDPAQSRGRVDPLYMAPLRPPPDDPLYARSWADQPLPKSFYEADAETRPWAVRAYPAFCDMLYGPVPREREDLWRAYQSYYFNCLRDVDRRIEAVLQALDAAELAENTIVIFTADHGEMAGAHGLRQKGPFAYRENVNVPLIVRGPGAAKGAETLALGSMIDLPTTILSYAGAEPDETLPGVSLAPAIADPAARTERDKRGVLFAYSAPLYTDEAFMRIMLESGAPPTFLGFLQAGLPKGRIGPSLDNPALHRGCFDGRELFVRYFPIAGHNRPTTTDALRAHNELELYDESQDPHQLDNLAWEFDPEDAVFMTRLENHRGALENLIDREIGEDRGASLPGPDFMKNI
jgi:arylsulfatase A-like enzyme